jgi:hypothetical protein
MGQPAAVGINDLHWNQRLVPGWVNMFVRYVTFPDFFSPRIQRRLRDPVSPAEVADRKSTLLMSPEHIPPKRFFLCRTLVLRHLKAS